MSGHGRTVVSRPVVVEPPAVPARGADQADRLRALAGAPGARRPSPAGVENARARVLTIASGKGGVGKTTLAVNLGVALCSLGWRTSLVDADAGTANVDLLCGVSPARRLESIGRDLVEQPPEMAGRLLRRIALEGPAGLRLVPGATGVRADEGTWTRVLRRAVEAASREGEVVIVDAAAGVGEQVLAMLGLAELCLVVTTPEPTSIADAYALIKCRSRRLASTEAAGREASPVALIVNSVQGEREAREVHGRIAEVARRFLNERVVLGGWVARDVRVGQAVRARRPLVLDHPRTRASRDVRDLAGRLVRVLRLEERLLRDGGDAARIPARGV